MALDPSSPSVAGPGGTVRCGSASTVGSIQVEQAQAGHLQAVEQHGGHPLHEGVSQSGVGLGLLTEAGSVDGDRPYVIGGTGIEVPPVGGNEPAPSDSSTGSHRLDYDRSSPRRVNLDGDMTTSNQVQRVSGVALREEQDTRIDGDVLGAARHTGYGIPG